MSTEFDLKEAIAALSRWVSNMRVEEMMAPDAESRSGREEAAASDDFRRGRIVRCRALSAGRILSARSCLDAIAHDFELPDPVPAVHALARVVVENCAWARWLSDTEIEGEQRVARAVSDELHGLKEKRKLALGSAEALAATYEAIARFRTKVRTADVTPAVRPSATTASGVLLGDEDVSTELKYRLFSAYTHGSSHVLLSSLNAFSDHVEPARVAVIGFLHAFDEVTKYVGWGGRPAWRRWASRTFDTRLRVDQ